MMPVLSTKGVRYCSIAAVILTLFSTSSAQPKISVDKINVDLGIVYNGTVKKARVVIKNIGRDTLRILGVSTSCGCTTAKQPKSALKPGESDAVEVEFNSTGFRGKIEKHVNIQTNDPLSPSTGVTLVCDVVEELQPINNASVVWLGSVPVGKEVEQIVSFKNISGKVITLMGYKSSSPDLSVSFVKRTVLPADTVRFSVKVTPKKTDYFNELLLLDTDSNKQSQVPVRVTLIGVTPN
jgi:hypothetical protein